MVFLISLAGFQAYAQTRPNEAFQKLPPPGALFNMPMPVDNSSAGFSSPSLNTGTSIDNGRPVNPVAPPIKIVPRNASDIFIKDGVIGRMSDSNNAPESTTPPPLTDALQTPVVDVKRRMYIQEGKIYRLNDLSQPKDILSPQKSPFYPPKAFIPTTPSQPAAKAVREVSPHLAPPLPSVGKFGSPPEFINPVSKEDAVVMTEDLSKGLILEGPPFGEMQNPIVNLALSPTEQLVAAIGSGFQSNLYLARSGQAIALDHNKVKPIQPERDKTRGLSNTFNNAKKEVPRTLDPQVQGIDALSRLDSAWWLQIATARSFVNMSPVDKVADLDGPNANGVKSYPVRLPNTADAGANLNNPNKTAYPNGVVKSNGFPPIPSSPMNKTTEFLVGAPLTGHSNWVYSVAFFPHQYGVDGHRMVSSGADGTIRIWQIDAINKTLAYPIGRPISVEKGWIFSVAVSPNGQIIASGGSDQAVRLWDANSGSALGAPLLDHYGDVYSVQFADNSRVFSAGADGIIRLWNLQTGRILATLSGHQGPVFTLAINHQTNTLASAGADGTIRLWNSLTGQFMGFFVTPPELLTAPSSVQPKDLEHRAHGAGIYALAFNSDGTLLASGGADNQIRLWGVPTGASLGLPIFASSHTVFSLAFSADNKNIIAGDFDGSIKIWNMLTSTLSQGSPFKGHTGWINSIAYDPKTMLLASASADGSIRLWHEKPKAANPPAPSLSAPSSVAPLTLTARSASLNKSPTRPKEDLPSLFTAADNARFNSDSGNEKVSNIAYSPNGQYWAAIVDGRIQQYHLSNGTPFGPPIVISDNATKNAQTVMVSAITYGANISTSISTSTSTSASTLIAGDTAGRLWRININDSRPHRQTRSKGQSQPYTQQRTVTAIPFTIGTAIRAVAISQDGMVLAAGGDDKNVYWWRAPSAVEVSIANEEALQQKRKNKKKQQSPRYEQSPFSPLAQVYTVLGHQGGITALSFSPDGALLLSGSDDQTIRLWDVNSGRSIGGAHNGHLTPITALVMNSKKTLVISGGKDGSMQRWKVAL